MALSSIAVRPDAARDAKARLLAVEARHWSRYTLKVAAGAFAAGSVFRLAPVSEPREGAPTHYRVNAVFCDCPDYATRGMVCKHIRAYLLAETERRVRLANPANGYELDAITDPTCRTGCGVPVSRPGMRCPEHDAARRAAVSTYDRLFPRDD